MVSLKAVQASNAQISSSLPTGLVAVFVGATSGIGEFTLRKFAEYAQRPRVYFVGRSQDAGNRISTECKKLNPNGEFNFIKADVSLIKVVDEVCAQIQSKEKAINLLILSQGTLVSGIETPEGLHLPASLAMYSRTRFIQNLLPQIRAATCLRRIVSVLSATKEGAIKTEDLQLRGGGSILSQRDHGASVVTLSMEALAKQAPEVSFVHAFPGPVRTGIARGLTGLMGFAMKTMQVVLGPFLYIPPDESGERHVFLATSARYPASGGSGPAHGVPVAAGVETARDTKNVVGGGVYSIDEKGESAGQKPLGVLAKLREEGATEKVWEDYETQIRRITAA